MFQEFRHSLMGMLYASLDIMRHLKDRSNLDISREFDREFDRGMNYVIGQLPQVPYFATLRELSSDMENWHRDCLVYATCGPETYVADVCGCCRDNGSKFNSKVELYLDLKQRLRKWDHLTNEMFDWTEE